MENLNDTLLYTLDKCFRTYHQFAQKNVRKAGYDITIDQWLILKSLSENTNLTQNELTKVVFKDAASISRIVELLVKRDYLTREIDKSDRRKISLKLTEKGQRITIEVNEIALKNRAAALNNIDVRVIEDTKKILYQIIKNCHENDI